MKFRDIQLLNGGKHSEEQLEQNRLLMLYWENIRNLFGIHTPKNLEFLGISKLNIKLGAFSGVPFVEPDKSGVATFRRNDFAFDEFCKLTEAEKHSASLKYVESSLEFIFSTKGAPDETKNALRHVIKQIRNDDFKATKTHAKTSKWHKSRKVKVLTELVFKKGGIDAILKVLDNSGAVREIHTIAESRFWEGLWSDLWKGIWKENRFVIENRFGETFYEIECSL